MIKYDPKKVVSSLLYLGTEKEDRKEIYKALRRVKELDTFIENHRGTFDQLAELIKEKRKLERQYNLAWVPSVELR